METPSELVGQATEQKPFPFLDLHPELRNEIYNLLLPAKDDPLRVDLGKRLRNSNIYFANQQTRREVAGYLSSTRKFHCTIATIVQLTNSIAFLKWCSRFAPLSLTYFKLHIAGVVLVEFSTGSGDPTMSITDDTERMERCPIDFDRESDAGWKEVTTGLKEPIFLLSPEGLRAFKDIEWEMEELKKEFEMTAGHQGSWLSIIARVIRLALKDRSFGWRPEGAVSGHLRNLRSLYMANPSGA